MTLFADKNWWTLKGDDLARAVTALGEGLWTADEPRRTEIEKNLRRFGGRQLRGLFTGRNPAPDLDNARLNITKAVTETLTAKVGSIRPRPKVLTNGANHSLRLRAKQLQRFLDGIYRATNVYRLSPLIFRDALLTGTGIAAFFPCLGKKTVGVERVFPPELLVDHFEGVNGNPQNLVRVKFLDKDVLSGMFPELHRDIENLTTISHEDLPEYVDAQDPVIRTNRMVKVFEAFHLAVYSESGKKIPGRRVMSSGGVLLADAVWEEDFPPFEFFHWSEPVRGFWGDSAVGEIRGLEKEVNRLLQKVQRAMRLVGQPWILNPTGGKVSPAKLTNETALIIDFSGPVPPTIQTFQPIHPQVLEQMWTLHAKAFAQLGTNELQASATKPPGIDSGRGLQQLSEEHLVRFKHVSRAFEDYVGCNFARQFVRVARDLDKALKAQGGEGYVIRATANRTVLRIKWSEAELSPDDFFLETWPTSVLPLTPSGRTEEVERWQANGWIDQQRAMTLLEFPDLDSEIDIATADSELLETQLEDMLDHGKAVFPEKEQDLQRALQRGTFALLRARVDGTPEDNLARLEDFLSAVEEMLQPPTVEEAPVPPVDPAMAMAMDPATAVAMPPGAAPPMPMPSGMPGAMPPV